MMDRHSVGRTGTLSDCVGWTGTLLGGQALCKTDCVGWTGTMSGRLCRVDRHSVRKTVGWTGTLSGRLCRIGVSHPDSGSGLPATKCMLQFSCLCTVASHCHQGA